MLTHMCLRVMFVSTTSESMSDKCCTKSTAKRSDWLTAKRLLPFLLLLIGLSASRGVAGAPSNPCGARQELERMRNTDVGVVEKDVLERVRTKLKVSLDHWKSVRPHVDMLYRRIHEQLGTTEANFKWLPNSKNATNKFKKTKCKKLHRFHLLEMLYNDLEIYVRAFRAVTQFPVTVTESNEKHHTARGNLSTKFYQEANALLCEVTEALPEHNIPVPEDRSGEPLSWDTNPNHTTALLQGAVVIHAYRKSLEVWSPILDALVKPIPKTCRRRKNKQQNQQQQKRTRRPKKTTPAPR